MKLNCGIISPTNLALGIECATLMYLLMTYVIAVVGYISAQIILEFEILEYIKSKTWYAVRFSLRK